jgi:beta-lactamase superfamily II metal-dependent hydrolase
MAASDTGHSASRIHLLDVGEKKYADCVLLQLDGKNIFIDGAHRGDDVGDGDHDSIVEQLRHLTGTTRGPVPIDLLIVTHMHDDHVGCLPELVSNRVIRCANSLALDPHWRWGGGTDAAPFDGVSIGAKQIAMALGEEPRPASMSDPEILAFLADAATLEDRYRSMLEDLARQGNLFQYDGTAPAALERTFASVGLKILGPSSTQLQVTQKRIASDAMDMFGAASDALRVDAQTDLPQLYRQLLRERSGSDDPAADGRGGSGAPINLQSLITLFRFDKRKALLTGDMQLADVESSDPVLRGEVESLRQRIAADAPYDFFKLPHHGSWNGFDQAIFDEIGDTRHFGISAGASSSAHPDASVLQLLADHEPHVQWARTDRNRLSTFSFSPSGVRMTIERGRRSDPRPPTDAVVSATTAPAAAAVRTESRVAPTDPTARGAPVVEVVTRIFDAPSRVRVDIEVDAQSQVRTAISRSSSREALAAPADLTALHIAGGRKLPRLLVVTSREGLGTNIGRSETDAILAAIRATPSLTLFDEIPAGLTEPETAVALVNAEVRKIADLEGLLILGGYDIVPATRVDCLSPDLRAEVQRSLAAGLGARDADEYIVWSDDSYAGRDPSDLLPDFPVSRIPDGQSAELVMAALSASKPAARLRSGMRNARRPFADGIFQAMPGSAVMALSLPLRHDIRPPFPWESTAYIMLHGSNRDGTKFWGEDPATGDYPTAYSIDRVPATGPEVVFAGCCWGALTVAEKANELQRGRAPSPKGVRDSIALAFLRAGSIGFVGCTGTHYSPQQAPFEYHGGPMHRAFWTGIGKGRGPAQALFDAKVEYLNGIPHGQTRPTSRAIEAKTLYQFTSLGLGW